MIRTIGALGALFFALVGGALAHDHAGGWAQLSPEINKWLREQMVPEGNGAASGRSCCSERDGDEAQEEIKYDESGKGHYWITSEHFPTPTLVPDEKIIKGPNKYGLPTVWWVGPGPYDIRCYAPGGGM